MKQDMNKVIKWENLENGGQEQLTITQTNDEILFSSSLEYIENHTLFHIRYEVKTDLNWRTKEIYAENVTNGKNVYLHTNNKGEWMNNHGEVKELQGCIDIDISVTPFSNSLPINRCSWKENTPKNFNMVYISVPEMTFHKAEQSYTLIHCTDKEKVFKYESGNFESFIYTDESGMVTLYPNLFKKI
ncbi:MAG: putative glycolipid-binding domain-containing protein [Bacillaceae bacterium]|nr:putative glycolipid-binding domain-containing protein [Bacillaceae bacterium]